MRNRLAVLMTALVIGASGGCNSNNPILQTLSQRQFEDCVTDNVFTMLRLVSKLETVMDLIANQGTPPAGISFSGSDALNYTFQCDFALSGVGGFDTRVTGALLFGSDPVANGLTGSVQVNNLIIGSIAPTGTLTGSGQVVVTIVDQDTTTLTGQVVLNDAGCDTTLTMNQPLTLTDGLPVGPTIQSTVFGLGISGVIDYLADFLFTVVSGQINIPDNSQTVTVTTDSSLLGTVDFDIFPEEVVVNEMVLCLQSTVASVEAVVDSIQQVTDEMGGADRPEVVLALPDFAVTSQAFQMTGTVTGNTPPLLFAFSFLVSSEAAATGQSIAPFLVTPPAGEIPGLMDGAYTVSLPDSSCLVRVDLSGVEYTLEQNFDKGVITITVTLGADELVLRLDLSEEEILDAISGTFNGIVLPAEVLAQLLFV